MHRIFSHRIFKPCRGLLFLAIALFLLLGLPGSTDTHAQNVPQCPPGFHFDRLSGVGCVQDNCFSIQGAYYNYVGSCTCGEGLKGCFQPIEGFDSSLCFPFCPASELTACISPDATCPGAAPPPAAPGDDPDQPALSADVEALLRNLEDFLSGEGHPISAGRSAAAAAAASALLSAWLIANLASGARLEDLLQAIKAWLSGTRPGSAGAEVPQTPLSSGGALPRPDGQDVGGQKPPPQPVRPPLSADGKIGSLPDPAKGADAGAAPPGAAQPPAGPPQVAPPSPAQPVAPAKPDARDQPPAIDPARLNQFQERFREMVDIALENDFFVANRSLIEKAWNNLPVGKMINILNDKYGGQCEQFADWGKQWTQSFAEEIFGKGVIVDTIYIGESTSEHAQVLVYDPIDWLDSKITANHTATRVILPNGESYILDYWQAVGDRQRGLFEQAADGAYGKIFGGQPVYPEARLVPEKEWIMQWQSKIGSSGDPAVVHNLHYAQAELKKYIDTSRTEAEAFARFRADRNRGVPDEQVETIINSWKQGGVWWGKQ